MVCGVVVRCAHASQSDTASMHAPSYAPTNLVCHVVAARRYHTESIQYADSQLKPKVEYVTADGYRSAFS